MCLVLDSQLFDGHRKYDVLHVTKSPNTFSTSKKSHLQAFQTLGQETKKFFKRRIPNNFTITRIKFGLEGIVYPLLLCLDQNSDGLLTIFFYFWASVWEEKCTSISVRFTQNAEAKFLAYVGFTSSS